MSHASRRCGTLRTETIAVAGAALLLVLVAGVALSEPPPEHHGAEAAAATDGRTPLPLLPMMADHQKRNMRDHLAAIREIVAALAKDDYDAVATATRRIGYSESMGRMCEHMGAGSPAFTPMALCVFNMALLRSPLMEPSNSPASRRLTKGRAARETDSPNGENAAARRRSRLAA